MYTIPEKPEILTEKDCLIDWKNYPCTDENGNDSTFDATEKREEWLQEECGCNEFALVDEEVCYRYYIFDYDEEKYLQWMKQRHYTKKQISYWGLIKMFNDGWIKSPAFVDWKNVTYFWLTDQFAQFVKEIEDISVRVEILKHVIANVDYIFNISRAWERTEYVAKLKNILNIHKEALKVQKEEEKRKAKEEKTKQKSQKQKPEYILSIDEIIQYVREENPESAYAIRAMLRYFAFEKDDWSNATIRNKIREIDQQVLVQGDYVQGNKNVGAHIESVQAGGIGAQTNKA